MQQIYIITNFHKIILFLSALPAYIFQKNMCYLQLINLSIDKYMNFFNFLSSMKSLVPLNNSFVWGILSKKDC